MYTHIRVAICFHLGYNDRYDQFTPYIDHVLAMCPHSDIYITYRENKDPTEMCRHKYPQAVIFKATHGCDTGAFLLQIKYMLESHKHYDYIFKLHTKSNNSVFPQWTHDLLDSIAGNHDAVNNVLHLLKHNSRIGMIAGKKWVLKRDIDCHIFHHTCRRNRIKPDGYFVGGTIFWIRYSIIRDICQHIDLAEEYAICELGKPIEPSYTHSWERIYGLMVSTCGYKIHGI